MKKINETPKKKLNLNKRTIVRLNADMMVRLNGGGIALNGKCEIPTLGPICNTQSGNQNCDPTATF